MHSSSETIYISSTRICHKKNSLSLERGEPNRPTSNPGPRPTIHHLTSFYLLPIIHRTAGSGVEGVNGRSCSCNATPRTMLMLTITKDKISMAIRLACVVIMSLVFYRKMFDGFDDVNMDTSHHSDFQLAKDESLGFFDNISSWDWNLLKQKVADMSPNYNFKSLTWVNMKRGQKM
jgi:hypothetical protein